jgi:hypothetical protein
MRNKNEIIPIYRQVRKEFSNLVMPSDDTPLSIANSLIETYNRYKSWLENTEAIADSQGWYTELVAIEKE